MSTNQKTVLKKLTTSMSTYFRRFQRLFKYEGKIKPLTFKTRSVLTYRSLKTWIWAKPKNRFTSYAGFLKDIWSIWKPIRKQTWERSQLEILIPTIATTNHQHIGIKWFPTNPKEVLKDWENGKSKQDIKQEVLDTSIVYNIDALSNNPTAYKKEE
jgi:hypothetical protein